MGYSKQTHNDIKIFVEYSCDKLRKQLTVHLAYHQQNDKNSKGHNRLTTRSK